MPAPNHVDLPFNKLHRTRLDSDVAALLPASPEGDGDVYYADDTDTLYVAHVEPNAFSDGFSTGFQQGNHFTWDAFDLAAASDVNTLADLDDVSSASDTEFQVLAVNAVDGGFYEGRELVSDDIPLIPASHITLGSFDSSRGGYNAAVGDGYISYFAGLFWSALGLGTNGQIIQLVAGFPAWVTAPSGVLPSLIGAKAYSTGTNITGTVPWNDEFFDTDNIHDNSSNNARLTAQTQGYYHIVYYWGGTITKGGFGQLFRIYRFQNSSLVEITFNQWGFIAHAIAYLGVNDYVQVSATDTLQTPNGEASAFFMFKIGS